MSQGIGVRYTAAGVRVIGLSRDGDDLTVTGITAGAPGDNLVEFLTENGFVVDDAAAVIGLCPGDFISVFMDREPALSDAEAGDHLRWEIERKLVSDPGDFIIKPTAGEKVAFAFAGRRSLIASLRDQVKAVIDTDAVALYNGCETSDEVGAGIRILVNVEPDGISAVRLDDGAPRDMEAVPHADDGLPGENAVLDADVLHAVPPETVDKLVDATVKVITRILGEGDSAVAADGLIIAGSCVYMSEYVALLESRLECPLTVSNPFASFPDLGDRFPAVADMGAAFTTAYGMAVRALEE